MGPNENIEQGLEFTPKFDANGLITAIAQDVETGQVLMKAQMNAEALAQTIKTGQAVYFSRSRQKLWKKGEQSGHVQKVERILVDCDQDCLILKVRVNAGQCHVGYQSCFYRALEKGADNKLEFIDEKVYDPKEAYKKDSSCMENTNRRLLKASLLLLGSFAFGYNIAMILQELGHTAAMWATGGNVDHISYDFFWSHTHIGSIPIHPTLTIWAGILLGPMLTLLVAVLIWRWRSPYVVLPIMACIVTCWHNAIYLIIDSIIKAGNDATYLIYYYDTPKIIVILVGLFLLVLGIVLGLLSIQLIGIRPSDSVKARALVFEGGILPFVVAMLIYHWQFVTTEKTSLCATYAVAAAVLVFLVALLTRIVQPRIQSLRTNEYKTVTWPAVILVNASAIILISILAFTLPRAI